MRTLLGAPGTWLLWLAPVLVMNSIRTRPVAEPELVQPGVISTDRNETFPSVDPIDGSLWFSVYEDDFGKQVILRAPREDSAWQRPATVSFSGPEWGDRAPRFSPHGERLYFSSSRPTQTSGRGGDYHLWVVERSGGRWGEARLLPGPVNSAAGADRHSSETRGGDLYWSSTRPGGAGRSDIYHARRTTSGWSAVTRLPAPVNDSLSQPDVLVSPDGSWMILVVTDHPRGLGGDDLLISRPENGRWSAPRPLPAPINSPEYEYGPSLSPDRRVLYFTSHRRGTADVYRIPVTALDATGQDDSR